MAKFLVNLEIIVESDGLLKSELETFMHKMLKDLKPDINKPGINIYDYGLDIDIIDCMEYNG